MGAFFSSLASTMPTMRETTVWSPTLATRMRRLPLLTTVPARDLVARGLFRRLKFAGNGALVNDRRAGDDRAVYGQLFAGVCLHLVARPEPVDGAALHAAVGQHFPGVLILHGEHLLDEERVRSMV